MIKFLDCIVAMTKDGIPKPRSIIWDTGKEYQIDKILDIRKLASTKGGGAGIRYTVRITTKERYLFLKDYKWFIEVD